MTDCTNPGECLTRHAHDRGRWCDACRRHVEKVTATAPAPKFAKGQRVRIHGMLTGYSTANINGEEGIVIGPSTKPGMEHRIVVNMNLDGSFPESAESFHPANLELAPEAPKFKPGDEVIVSDPNSTHYGNRYRLKSASIVGDIRVWDVVSHSTGSAAIGVFAEHRLSPATIREPVIARPEIKEGVMVKLLPPHPHAGDEVTLVNVPLDKGMMCLFRWDNWHYAYAERGEMEALPIATIVIRAEHVERRADPRPEPTADSPQDHDGQANTSGEKARDISDIRGRSILADLKDDPSKFVQSVFSGGGYRGVGNFQTLKDTRDIGEFLADFIWPKPSTLSVVEGAERWKLIDPAHRRVSIQSSGHVVQLWATVIPQMVTGHMIFCSPYTAPEVMERIDKSLGLWAVAPEAEITMAKNPAFKFSEDIEL